MSSVAPSRAIQATGKPRIDPSEYAKQRAAKVQHAKDLREQRKSGFIEAEEPEAPTKQVGRAATGTRREVQAAPPDTLDQFYQSEVRRLPTPRRNEGQQQECLSGDPGLDSLAHEVKRKTGFDIPEQPASARSQRSQTSQLSQHSHSSQASTSAAVQPERGQRGRVEQPIGKDLRVKGREQLSESDMNPHQKESLRLLKSKIANRRSSSRGSFGAYQPELEGNNVEQPENNEYAATKSLPNDRHREGPSSRAQQVAAAAYPAPTRQRVVVSPKRAAPPGSSLQATHQEAHHAIAQPQAHQPSQRAQRAPPSRQQGIGAGKGGSGAVECTRKMGCPCPDCSSAEAALSQPVPPHAAQFAEPQEGEYEDIGPTVQCPDCGRSFKEDVFAKHEKVCKKVFLSKRKPIDMSDKRLGELKDENGNPVAPPKASAGGAKKKAGADSQKIEKKSSSWKEQSSAFRNMLKGSKEVTQALKEGRELPPPVPSAPDPSLILCPNCGRRFNEKAAERHIPKCADIKARPTALKKGAGKGLGAASRAIEKSRK